MASWDFASVEQRFAEAALDPSRWVTALEAVTAATESFGTVLIPNTGGLLPNVPFTEQMEPSADTYFRDGWHLQPVRPIFAFSHGRQNSYAVDTASVAISSKFSHKH
jgi:hypothetical protein